MYAGLYACDSKEDSQRKTRTAKPYRMFCYADALPKISSFVTFTTVLVQIQEEEHSFTDSCNNRGKQTGYLWHNVSLWAVVLSCSNNGAFKEIIILWLYNLHPYMDFTIPIGGTDRSTSLRLLKYTIQQTNSHLQHTQPYMNAMSSPRKRQTALNKYILLFQSWTPQFPFWNHIQRIQWELFS